jgi:hypothetical protein
MDIKQDFVPSINTAQVINTIAVVTIRCPCVKKEIIMGQMGIPLICNSCKRVWFVSATSKIRIQEVLSEEGKSNLIDLVNQ